MTGTFARKTEVSEQGRDLGASRRKRRWATEVVPNSGAILVAILLVVAAVFARDLYSVRNLQSIADQSAGLGVVALGQMLVVLIAGIDMSVSAVILLGAVIIVKNHASAPSIVLAAVMSIAVGVLNGVIVARRRVPAFIGTFAMLILLDGIELVYTQGSAGGSVPSWMHTLGARNLGGVPLPLIVWLGLAALLAGLLHCTVAGRWIYAIGTNAEAARFAGVPLDRVRVCCFACCSVLALLGGIMLAGYSGYVDQTLGNGANLDSIAAVVIGGTALVGGQGRVSGAISGVLVIVLANNIVVLSGLEIYWQYVVSGVVLILAVVVQSLGSGSGPTVRDWLRDVASIGTRPRT
jgi:ribose transport system permease protein